MGLEKPEKQKKAIFYRNLNGKGCFSCRSLRKSQTGDIFLVAFWGCAGKITNNIDVLSERVP